MGRTPELQKPIRAPQVPGGNANLNIVLSSALLFSSHLISKVYEASMSVLFRQQLILWLAICLPLTASAQERPRLDLPTPNAAAGPTNTPTALTGKERLGKKWDDEQRIDNCNVPIDKRGNKPRSSACPHVPMG